jgi:hypothetical protein
VVVQLTTSRVPNWVPERSNSMPGAVCISAPTKIPINQIGEGGEGGENYASACIGGSHAGMHRSQWIADNAYGAKAGYFSSSLRAISPAHLCFKFFEYEVLCTLYFSGH